MFGCGRRLFGPCDRLEGVGHVATEFLQVAWLPVVALRGFLVLEGSDDRRIEIPVRPKSLVSAWLRALLLAATLALGVAALLANGAASALGLGAAGALAGFYALGWLLSRTGERGRAALLYDAGLLEDFEEEPLTLRSPRGVDAEEPLPVSLRSQQRRAAEAQQAAWAAIRMQTSRG
jgi:hypothetical protein